jgi:hypothetical protein
MDAQRTPEEKSRPILFSAPMVLSILDGRKTQTRRIAKAIPEDAEIATADDWNAVRADERMRRFEEWGPQRGYSVVRHADGSIAAYPCQNGRPGELLWVRETYAYLSDYDGVDPGSAALASRCFYRADHPTGVWSERDPTKSIRWRPSIHMPRWASRVSLRVSNVRLERLQDITEADILAEGVTVDRVAKWCDVPWSSMPTLHDAWCVLWDHINGYGAWEENPLVWALSLERLETMRAAA